MAANESAGFFDCMPPPTDATETATAVVEAETGDCSGEGFHDDDLTMDLDQFMFILNEDQDSGHAQFQSIPEETQHSNPEESLVRSFIQVECPPHADFDKSSDFQSDFKETGGKPALTDVDTACSDVERPGHLVDSFGNSNTGFKPVDLPVQVRFQAEASASFKEWHSMGSGSDYCCPDRAVHHPEYNMQGCSAVSTLADVSAYQVIDCKDRMDPAWSNYDTKFQCGYMNYDIDLKCASECPIKEHPNVEFGQHGDLCRNCTGTSENLESNSFKSVEMSCLDADTSSRNATSTESVCQSSDGVSDWYYNNMVRQCSDKSLDFNTLWDQNHFSTCFKTSQSDEGMIKNSNRVGDSRNESASCSSRISSNAREERADTNGQRLFYNSGRYTSPIRGNYFSDADSVSFDEAVPAGSLACSRPYIPGVAQTAPVKNVMQDSLLAPMDTMHRYAQTTEAAVSNRSIYDVDENPIFDRCSEQFSAIPQEFETSPNDVSEGAISAGKRNLHSFVPQRLQAYPKHEDEVLACKKARHSYEMVDGVTRSSTNSGYMNVKASEPYLRRHPQSVFSKRDFTKEESHSQPCQLSEYVDDLSYIPESYNDSSYMNVKASEPYLRRHPHSASSKQDFTKEEGEDLGYQLIEYDDDLSLFPGSYNGDTSRCNVQGEDDSDVCIIKEVSCPVRAPQSVVPGNSIVASRHAISSESNIPLQHSTISRAVGYSGVGGSRLRVSDERLVFRVALQDLSQPRSEASPPDGFLAVPLLRHQRIALSWMVQKETNSLHCSGGILADDQGLGKTVSTIALILKERPSSSRVVQEDIQQVVSETLNLDEDDDSVLDIEKLEPSTKNLVQSKGRPAAGTLVVCPTSVLRQWAEELQNKVTSKAKLSVLVYHGSNRTKDPSDLAKYDVVLTTYSIVSMEVPKQPFGDKDDHDKKDLEVLDLTSTIASSSKSSKKKSSKKYKEKDSILLESLARPLAKVGWFRVVLDEAQSIKNHKTQVARACWGLRAKRRWCLSGTPIQNTIDDLYSYFRFLRYDPYSVYKSFCNTIKFPISKNPMRGYKKLQAVLKTIMLRRTKGTLLDGKPIINLPPKFVELKKVDFSWKERDFYARLEADSRAQFAEYAAAGTVKQNYVNILLMLLRLRQACDHPLLVKKYDSGSAWKSSAEMLKKLPQERQQLLLNCLEGSMAICGICNDPPEDAVVSICGHVFCYQCISDHLTMDDRKCPARNCKDRLSESCVFSKVTLISSLSLQSGTDSLLDCPAASEGIGISFEDGLFESSKIMAAIEVLQALRPQDCALSCNSVSESSDENLSRLENSCDTQLKRFSNDASKDQNSYGPVKVIGEKAIVFSQWTRMLDLLEGRMKKSSIQYRRLDGTMSVTARDKAVKEFNTIPEVSVMIMSLKAASLGLNMVAACHVILLDLWWNPTTEDQAVDRAHRIGQTRPVKVLRLTVKDTVEDRILALQEKKREMVASAFGEDETGSCQSRLTVEDLKYLFMA